MLTFIIIGIVQGAVIGLVALGIVLVYKGSRVFNFAQAEFGTLAAFFLYFLIEVVNVPYAFAAILALVGVGLVGFLVERLIVRPLFGAPRVTLLVATAGVALLAIAFEVIIGGAQIRALSPALSGQGFSLFGTRVDAQHMLILVVLGGLAAGLAYFFNKTDLGLAVLATSQEPVATELVGIGTKRISTFVWSFAAVLGGIAGLLQGPDTTFTPGFMTTNFLLLGFTAAIVGGVTSLAGAFVGGQIVGITSALASYFDSSYLRAWVDADGQPRLEIPAFHELVVFIVLLAILLVKPNGLLGKEA